MPTPKIVTPSAVPYLLYNDLAAMSDFLVDAFGLTRVSSHTGPDGEAGQVELALGDFLIMLGRGRPDMGLSSPADLPLVHAGVLAYVADVDQHFERAKAAGAQIWYEPQDMPYGQREYGARDPENGFWSFATITR